MFSSIGVSEPADHPVDRLRHLGPVAVLLERDPVAQRDLVDPPRRRLGDGTVRRQVGRRVVLAGVEVAQQVVEGEVAARHGAAVAAGLLCARTVAHRRREERVAGVGRRSGARVGRVRRDVEQPGLVAALVALEQRQRPVRDHVRDVGPVDGRGRGVGLRRGVVDQLDLVALQPGQREVPPLVATTADRLEVVPPADARRGQPEAADDRRLVLVEVLPDEPSAIAGAAQRHVVRALGALVGRERGVPAEGAERSPRGVGVHAVEVGRKAGEGRGARGAAQAVDHERVLVGSAGLLEPHDVRHRAQQLGREVVHHDDHDVGAVGSARRRRMTPSPAAGDVAVRRRPTRRGVRRVGGGRCGKRQRDERDQQRAHHHHRRPSGEAGRDRGGDPDRAPAELVSGRHHPIIVHGRPGTNLDP